MQCRFLQCLPCCVCRFICTLEPCFISPINPQTAVSLGAAGLFAKAAHQKAKVTAPCKQTSFVLPIPAARVTC